MNVKRFFGANMTEVMGRIRLELGPDAVILSSRMVRQGGLFGFFRPRVAEVMVAHEDSGPAAGIRPVVNPTQNPKKRTEVSPERMTNRERAIAIAREVVEARNQQEAQEAQPVPQPAPQPSLAKPPVPAQPAAVPQTIAESSDIAELNARMERFGQMLTQIANRVEAPAQAAEATEHSAEVQPYLQHMLAQEVQADLAHAIASRAEEKLGTGISARDAVKGVIVDALGKSLPIKVTGKKQTVVMLAGPTGVGKTTSLIKLAAQFIVQHDVRIGLINADTYRIGAKEQIASYADILRAPLRVVYSAAEMEKAMEELADCDAIFVDTPGKKPSDEGHKDDVGRYIEICKPTHVLLAISASTSNVAAREVIRHYSFINKYALLITKMDEVQSAAAALNARFFAKMPLSYVAWGQGVPDELSVAKPERIAEALLGSGTPW